MPLHDGIQPRFVFIDPPDISVAIFIVINLIILVQFFYAVHHAFKNIKIIIKTILGTSVFLGLFSLVVASGLPEENPIPLVPLVLALINLSIVILAFSPFGKTLSLYTSFRALVAFQVFRLPLELVLHQWVQAGTIPETMTWSGQNWDIISGILGLVIFPFAEKNHSLVWLFNFVGFSLLINVMRVAILSSPFPFAWQVEPPLQLMFHLPYAFIVPICVGGALAGHIILTRVLIAKGK